MSITFELTKSFNFSRWSWVVIGTVGGEIVHSSESRGTGYRTKAEARKSAQAEVKRVLARVNA
jgi:hypothetical protein